MNAEQANVLRRIIDALGTVLKASEDDHYYGAWVGGRASSGGHPKGQPSGGSGPGTSVADHDDTPDFEVHEHANLRGGSVTHSHEHTARAHAGHGPARLTIDRNQWAAQTGLRGGGTKHFTKRATGPQFD